MTELDIWLQEATRCLAAESAIRVRSEILDHFDSSRKASLHTGAGAAEAEKVALRSLGSAKDANRRYREVLLTSAEMKVLREGSREARVVCAWPSLRWIPVALLVAAVILLSNGDSELG